MIASAGCGSHCERDKIKRPSRAYPFPARVGRFIYVGLQDFAWRFYLALLLGVGKRVGGTGTGGSNGEDRGPGADFLSKRVGEAKSACVERRQAGGSGGVCLSPPAATRPHASGGEDDAAERADAGFFRGYPTADKAESHGGGSGYVLWFLNINHSHAAQCRPVSEAVARLRCMNQPIALPPERQAWRAMAALSLGFFISLLDQTMIAVALPEILRAFDANVNHVLWVSAIYLLAVVVPLLFTGRLGDIYGQKKMFQLGVGLFGVGALLCALAPSVEFLIAARAVQGFGASIQMPQTMAVINRVFARERRGRALGVWGIVGSVASLAGPLLGGFVVASFGWQAVFWVHIPFVVLAIVLAGAWVPALPTTGRKIDYVSVAASFVALSCLVFAVQQGPETGWPWWIWALLVVGIAGVGVFITLQQRSREPLVPLELFADRNYSAGSVAIVAMGFMAASMMIPIMMWLQGTQGLSARDAGLIVTPMALVSLCVSPLAGILADKLDPRRLAATGFGVLIATFIGMWFLMHAGVAAWWLSVPCAALGAGQSFIWGSNAATSMRDIEPQLMGAASGVYNTSRQVGSVSGVAAVSAVMQVAGVANSMVVIIAVLAVGWGASLFFRDTLHVVPETACL